MDLILSIVFVLTFSLSDLCPQSYRQSLNSNIYQKEKGNSSKHHKTRYCCSSGAWPELRTHAGRCWGLWRLSRDAGRRMVYTAHICVLLYCVGSCHKLLHWHPQKPQTPPCQSDTCQSAGCSYTLKTQQERGLEVLVDASQTPSFSKKVFRSCFKGTKRMYVTGTTWHLEHLADAFIKTDTRLLLQLEVMGRVLPKVPMIAIEPLTDLTAAGAKSQPLTAWTHFCRRWCCVLRLVSREGRGRSPGTVHSWGL